MFPCFVLKMGTPNKKKPKIGQWTLKNATKIINLINKFSVKQSPPLRNSPSRARAYQPTFNLTSTCPQTMLNHFPTRLGVICGQYVPSRCWLNRPGLLVQISSYINFFRYWSDTDPIHWPKILPQTGNKPAPHSVVRADSGTLETS